MLKHGYLDAKIGFDTDENEPSKVGGSSWGTSPLDVPYPTTRLRIPTDARPTLKNKEKAARLRIVKMR